MSEVVTYRLNGRGVYVTACLDYSDALQAARDEFPDLQNVSDSQISFCVNIQQHSNEGFRWEYVRISPRAWSEIIVTMGRYQIIDIYVDRPDVGVSSVAEQDQPTAYSSNRNVNSGGMGYGTTPSSNYPTGGSTWNRSTGYPNQQSGQTPANQYNSNPQYPSSTPANRQTQQQSGGPTPSSGNRTNNPYGGTNPSPNFSASNYGSNNPGYPAQPTQSTTSTTSATYRPTPSTTQSTQTRGQEDQTYNRPRDTTNTWRR